MSASAVSLIMLAWNRAALTARALRSLLDSDIGDSEIIVVDNGSSDATTDVLAQFAPRVRSLRLAQNLGFVRGNNAGIAAAVHSNDVVLLNNDLLFEQHDWLPRLRACAYADARCGIAGVRLVDAQGRLLHAGSRVLPDDGFGVQIASGRAEIDVGQYTDADHVVEGVVFAAVYIKREVIEAIGPLHEDYVTYAEDSDYCLRARVAGWDTRLCGGVTLRHDQHGSTGDDAAWRAQLLAAGQAMFARHWATALRAQYSQELTVVGALDFPRDIAAGLRPLLRALDAAGIRLRYRSLYATVLPEAIAENGDSQDHLFNTIRRRGHEACPAVALCVGDIILWPQVQAGYRIGFADFDRLDDAEIAILRSMDEIWTPTVWHLRQLAEAGLRVEAGCGAEGGTWTRTWTPTNSQSASLPVREAATAGPPHSVAWDLDVRNPDTHQSRAYLNPRADLDGADLDTHQASADLDTHQLSARSSASSGIDGCPGSVDSADSETGGCPEPCPADSRQAGRLYVDGCLDQNDGCPDQNSRVRHLPWGVDPPYAHPGLRAPRASTGERIVLCLASWDELDQPGRLLEAWTHTFRREEAVRLLLWVDALGMDLAAATRDLNLDVHGGRYSLLARPPLAEEQRNAIFAAADMVLSSSRSRRHGHALLQALACGRPVVALAVSGVADWLDDHGGWAVTPAQGESAETALLVQLRTVLADLPTAQRRALDGSQRLREHSNWATVAARARDYLRRPLPSVPRQPAVRSGHGLIVLGMHRSGTSCVAGLLQLMGAYAGEPGGFLADPAGNPRGFVERGDLHLACVAALRRRGGDWSVPLGWDAASLPAARAQWRDDWRDIQAQLDAHAPWLIKEPRLCLLLEEIIDLIASPVLIQVIREPVAAAASLMRRHRLTAPHALALWAQYNRGAAALRRGRAGYVLDYHSLLAQPRPTLRRLLDFLRGLGVRGLREPDAEEVAAWIGPQLARQRHARTPQPNAAQQQLWLALRAEVDGGGGDVALPPADEADTALLLQIAKEHQAAMALEKDAM